MKNKKNKAKKNKGFEVWLLKKSPFSKKITRTILISISVANFIASGLFFTETISNLEKSQEVAQFFQDRSQNTVSR